MFYKLSLNKLIPVIVLTLLCIPTVLPYFNQGYFPTHDGEWAVVRLSDMFRTLRDFQFPARFSGALNFGYGYPLFNFAYPFPYYLGILLYFPLQSFIISIKTIFVMSVFFSAIFMYLASTKLWNSRQAGFVSAILYIYLPYRMLDLYVRGSIGESVSLALFPLILYLSIKLFDSAFSRFTVVFLAISIGILVTSHNIMTVLFVPLVTTFVLARIFLEKRYDVLQSFLLCLVLGAGLSSFFWIPALYEKSNIALSIMPIADRNLYFVNIEKLMIPSWGYGSPTEQGGFSYQLGTAQITTIIIGLAVLLVSAYKSKFLLTPAKKYAMIFAIIYILYFLMMFSFTSIIWQNTPLLSEINYPWTILSQLGFLSAILAGFVLIQGRLFNYLLITISLIAVVTTVGYAKPQSYNNNPDNFYLTNEATTTSSDELMPLWVIEKPTQRFTDKVEVIEGEAKLKDLKYNSNSISFGYDATSDPVFKINTIYYPGWQAYINAIKTDISYDNPQGVMIVTADKFSNKIYLQFVENLPRTLANGLSIISFLVLLFILLRPILLFRK